MNRKLRIGVFGGCRGKVMIDVLLKHPHAELVAVCDKYQPLLDEVGKKALEFGLDVKCFLDFEDFIKYDMDAVVLANYATEHAQFAIRCLRAGKHVMSEVLPSETLAQAVELVETIEETGLVYTYAENYCYMDNTFEMWRRYGNGDIGELKYAECEYIHDCEGIWLDLTYGDVDHWRNNMYPTMYCTHSLGPVLMATGLRPKTVVGFEGMPIKGYQLQGHKGGGAYGIEMVTLDNGAVVKSIHGSFKRPSKNHYRYYGSEGTMLTLENSTSDVYIYQENGKYDNGDEQIYTPEAFVSPELRKTAGTYTHGGSDFYSTHFFVEKIIGGEDGKWAIDIYRALDMSLCGIFAYRSILEGNKPFAIPDFRIKEEREPYRNDNICTNPSVAGGCVLPCSSKPQLILGESEARALRERWLEKEKAKNG